MVELHTEPLADHEWKEVALIRKKINSLNKEFSTRQSVKLSPAAAENPQADLKKVKRGSRKVHNPVLRILFNLD